MSIGIVDGFEDIPIPQALTLRIQTFLFNASRFFPKNISTRNPTTAPHCYATILRHFLLNFPSNHLPLSYFISLISFPFPISAAARGKPGTTDTLWAASSKRPCPRLLFLAFPERRRPSNDHKKRSTPTSRRNAPPFYTNWFRSTSYTYSMDFIFSTSSSFLMPLSSQRASRLE